MPEKSEYGIQDLGAPESSGVPLCVDLDGTLIHTDILYESFFLLIKKNPLFVFRLPFWLLRGKAFLKREMAKRVQVNVEVLPYNQELLAFLRDEKAKGRKLILVTASDELIAKKISDYLNIFTEVFASDGRQNLSGVSKATYLRDHYSPFDYAGNSPKDRPVWRFCRSAIVVNSPRRVVDPAKKVASVKHIFESQSNRVAALIKAVRLHQWVKNLLVFVPLLTSHTFLDLSRILLTGYAFMAFSLCASSIYVINDLLDLEVDRLHPKKRLRPFASGRLPLVWGWPVILFLLFGCALMTLRLPYSFSLVLSVYFVCNLLYSFYLKEIVLLDIFLLAGFYTGRLVGGHLAAEVPFSPWLLAFSVFIFLSLAFLKRYAELLLAADTNETSVKGRGYLVSDLNLIPFFGIVSGYMSVLVFSLYIHSERASGYYRSPMFLWGICPLLLYWISRLWLITGRGQMHEDPVMFAVKDKVSYLISLLILVFMALATNGL